MYKQKRKAILQTKHASNHFFRLLETERRLIEMPIFEILHLCIRSSTMAFITLSFLQKGQ